MTLDLAMDCFFFFFCILTWEHFFIAFYFFYCIFSITIYSPYTPNPHNHHTVAHAHEFFFLSAESLHLLAAPIAVSLPSILLVSSVCSLDSTYEWNHMVFLEREEGRQRNISALISCPLYMPVLGICLDRG